MERKGETLEWQKKNMGRDRGRNKTKKNGQKAPAWKKIWVGQKEGTKTKRRNRFKYQKAPIIEEVTEFDQTLLLVPPNSTQERSKRDSFKFSWKPNRLSVSDVPAWCVSRCGEEDVGMVVGTRGPAGRPSSPHLFPFCHQPAPTRSHSAKSNQEPLILFALL